MMGAKEGVKKRMSCWYGPIRCGTVYWVWGPVELGGDIIVMSGSLLQELVGFASQGCSLYGE